MRRIAELISLSGRVAVITGGAGHIGAAMAGALAELGCQICLVDLNQESLLKTSNQLKADWGVRIECLPVDLENETQRASIQQSVGKLFGRLDILINNAAFVADSHLQGWVTSFEDQRVDTWRRALEVNLTAAFHLSQSLAPMLRESKKGTVINIGSIYGVSGPNLSLYEGTSMGNPAAYAASKGGLIQLTRWLSTVLAPAIRVNCISPGGVFRNQPDVFVERYVSGTPLGRMGMEEDFKGAIAYLASDMSAYVTGQNLMVDGGWTAW